MGHIDRARHSPMAAMYPKPPSWRAAARRAAFCLFFEFRTELPCATLVELGRPPTTEMRSRRALKPILQPPPSERSRQGCV